MKLNIGCGGKILDGYVNVDVANPRADKLMPATDLRYFGNGTAEEILAIHLFEHLYRWEVEPALAEWNRVLARGGRLILEMPDVIKCARNLLENTKDQLSMWGLYGDPRYKDPHMCHPWGWTFKTIKPVLESAGFVDVTEGITHWHASGRVVRDFRVEAIKA